MKIEIIILLTRSDVNAKYRDEVQQSANQQSSSLVFRELSSTILIAGTLGSTSWGDKESWAATDDDDANDLQPRWRHYQPKMFKT